MNSLGVYRRLRAYAAGRPLPLGTTRRVHVARPEDTLVVAFLRMGGESRPWGIAWGPPGRPPRIETVPEARNRELVAGLAAQFAPDLLAHLRAGATRREDLLPVRQVWLPNPSHLEMLHHLNYAFTFARNSAPDLLPRLRALGRACGWLYRDAQRPGSQHAQVATQALREAYTFPAEDVRQGHLGYLLAWLSPGTRESRAARAALAEREAVATALDPTLERDRLEPLVVRWRDEPAVAPQVHQLLAAELDRRFRLTCEAVEALRSDPRRENRGLRVLLERASREQWDQHLRVERLLEDDPGARVVPSPETDRFPAAAAARYLTHVACADERQAALLEDDEELLAEVIAGGDGFRGEIVDVRDAGNGRAVRPIWVVEAPAGPLRLREESRVCQADLSGRTGRLLPSSDESRETPYCSDTFARERWQNRRASHQERPEGTNLRSEQVARNRHLMRTKSPRQELLDGKGLRPRAFH